MRNPAFHRLLEEIAELHNAKNSDYAQDTDPLSNFRRSEAFGVPAFKGVLVRLSDKWSRIEQLTSGKAPKNESLRDSLIDSAVYSLLAILLLDEQQAERLATIRAGVAERLARDHKPEPVGQLGYVIPEEAKIRV